MWPLLLLAHKKTLQIGNVHIEIMRKLCFVIFIFIASMTFGSIQVLAATSGVQCITKKIITYINFDNTDYVYFASDGKRYRITNAIKEYTGNAQYHLLLASYLSGMPIDAWGVSCNENKNDRIIPVDNIGSYLR